MALTKNDVSALYVAIFNRASEGDGNTYWQAQGTIAEVAEAMLATAPAAEYFGSALDDDRAFIEHIYLNTLGKTAEQDAEGIEFWVGQLAESGRGEVIARLIESALDPIHQTTDAKAAQDLFNNMVAVSNYTADTIEEAPEDLSVLRFDEGLSAVTADPASVEAGKKAVDNVLNPVDPVVEALDNLAAANKAKTDFLKDAGVALKLGEGVSATEANIEAAVTSAAAVLVAGSIDVDGETETFGKVFEADDSAAVKAAKVGDKRDELSTELAAKQKVLDEATAEVIKIAGLPAALVNLEAASKAADAAAKAVAPAATKVTAEIAKLDELYDAEFSGAVDTNASPAKLNTGFTEAKYPGVTELLNLTQAHQAAAAAAAGAQVALYQASAAVVWLDAQSGAKDALGELVDAEKFEGGADKLTLKEVQVELDKRLEADQAENPDVAIELDAYGNVIAGTAPTYAPLQAALVAFQSNPANQGDASQEIVNARTDVATAQATLDAFELALSNQQAANALAQELESKTEAIEAAEEAFEDLGVAVPKSIDGAVVGTVESDLFTVSENNGSILNFGLQGEDRIYVGSDFQLVELSATQDITKQALGDASLLEIFAKQSGANTELWVEEETFGGNASSTTDLVKITLSGVSVDDLVLEDGFLAIA